MDLWEPEYFHWVNGEIRVGTHAVIDTSLAADPAVEILGPCADNDAGTEVIQVRRICYVPPAYVHLLLVKPLPPVRRGR